MVSFSRSRWLSLSSVLVVGLFTAGGSGAMTLDFSPFADGQAVDGQDVGFGVIANGTGGAGAAIFDTAAASNCSGAAPDLDLCVAGQGNVLIVQSASDPTQTVPGIFDRPNDQADFMLTLVWPTPVTLESMTLIDWDTGTGGSMITIMDVMGNTAVWSFPSENWTGEVGPGNDGLGVFLLNDFMSAQVDNGPAASVPTVDPGFDPSQAKSLSVKNPSSGAIDDITFTPEPSTAVLVAFGLLGLIRAGRRRAR